MSVPMLDSRTGLQRVADPISGMHLGTKLTPGKLVRILIQAFA